MTKSNKVAANGKPEKPRPDFPLFPHAVGKWAKTIRGKMYYFGRWDDPHGAESEYLAVKDDLEAGRKPRPKSEAGGPTLREVCNAFMKSKRMKLDAGNLSPRTFVGYDGICQFLMDELGKERLVADLVPADFDKLYGKLAKKYGTTSLGGQITQIRSVFKHAEDNDFVETRIKFGSTFKAPSKSDVRKAKAKQKHKNGGRTFEASEIRQMLDAAPTLQLKAMILLGINCGFGNSDCSSLTMSAVDLQNGWIDYPRAKTGIERRIPLWPETVDALRTVIANRKEPANPADAGLVFLTKRRVPWVKYDLVETKVRDKVQVSAKTGDNVAQQTGKLLKALGIKRPGLSFYSLRHTFETTAGGSRDQVAVDAIMGHVDPSMASVYRHSIGDDRLRAVVAHVRNWLFGV